MITGVKELILYRDLENGQILLDMTWILEHLEKKEQISEALDQPFPVCMTWLSWQEIMALRTICGIII